MEQQMRVELYCYEGDNNFHLIWINLAFLVKY